MVCVIVAVGSFVAGAVLAWIYKSRLGAAEEKERAAVKSWIDKKL